MNRRGLKRRVHLVLLGLILGVGLGLAQGEAPVLPQGIIPVPEEPGILVSLKTDKDTYAPGDTLKISFTLSKDAYVYLYDLTPDGRVRLIVPNRYLQDPHFPAGTHTIPTPGWVLRVTEPEGWEFFQALASEEPLSFYEAKAFEKDAFLLFTDPGKFAGQLQEMLAGNWGTAWTSFRVHRPKAALTVTTHPAGADIWANGSYLGTAPLTRVFSPGTFQLLVEKEGYEPRTLDLSLADGEEVSLVITLSRSWPSGRPSQGEPPKPENEGTFQPELGLALGVGSLAVEIWVEVIGFGLAVLPSPSPLPPPAMGWVTVGPELEGYLGAWLPLGRLGGVVLGGLSFQETAWTPEWTGSSALAPLVEVEPEIRWRTSLTLGVGLGVSGSGWRTYLAWHNRRGIVLGFALGL